jgi:F-type H+-transporting ATPase subunit delta
MSRGTVIAKRYAKALFEIAQQQNIVSAVESELKAVVQALESDPEIVKFLNYPNIDSAKKAELLTNVLAGKVSQPVIHTLELLLDRDRQHALGEIYGAYTKIAGEALGQADATIYTAKSLDPEELSKVAAQFGALVGKTIRAEQIVNPALLGGIQVRIGDRLYDGSLSGKLARLEKALKTQAL